MDDRAGYLDELRQIAINGYERYKPAFDKLNDAYLLVLEPEILKSLKVHTKAKFKSQKDLRRANGDVF